MDTRNKNSEKLNPDSDKPISNKTGNVVTVVDVDKIKESKIRLSVTALISLILGITRYYFLKPLYM